MQRDAVERDDSYLLDMLIAARDIQTLARDLTREQFEASLLHQNSLIRLLTVIGEAANQVSEQMRSEHPDVPWRPMIAFRNRLVHGYFEIEIDLVWDAVQDDVPALIRIIEPLVPPPAAEP